mgnify:FL=1
MIDSPEITYELSTGGSNLNAIMKNLEAFVPKSEGGEDETTPAETEEEGKSLLIRKFVLKGATVNLSATILQGQSVSLTLPTIELNDIGGKGKSRGETIQELYAAVLKAIEEAVAESGALGDAVNKTVDSVKKQTEGVLDGVKGLFGK